jgi:hypothetical protein
MPEKKGAILVPYNKCTPKTITEEHHVQESNTEN